MSGKRSFNIYAQSDVVERFKGEVGNASKELEEYMRQRVNASSDITRRIEEICAEIEELEEEKENLTHKLENLRIEKKTLEAQKAREDETPDELDRFKDVFEKQDWRSPEEIPDYWSRELDKSKEELWEEVAG